MKTEFYREQMRNKGLVKMRAFICRVFHFKHWQTIDWLPSIAECNKCGWTHKIGKKGEQ